MVSKGEYNTWSRFPGCMDDYRLGHVAAGFANAKMSWQSYEVWLRQLWLAKPSILRPTHLQCRQKNLSSQMFLQLMLSVLLLISFSNPVLAARINFDNCLEPGVINSDPLQLQLIPLIVTAFFNTSAPSHTLNVTVYGNVSGKATQEPLPPPDDPHWRNPNATLGKLTDLNNDNHQFSTLKARYNVLSYTPYVAPFESFCNSTLNAQCPIGPSFNANS